MEEDGLVILDGGVGLAVGFALGDLHEEAGDERAADVLVVLLVVEGGGDELELLALHDALELQAHVVGGLEGAQAEEVVVAPLSGVLLGGVAFEGVVDVEEGEVVAVGVGEEVLHLVGAFAVAGGADEDLGDGEEGGEAEDLVGAVEFGRGDEHDGEGGVEGEFRGEAAEVGEVAVVVEAGEVVELFESAHECFGCGWVHQVEVDEVIDAELLEFQHCG